MIITRLIGGLGNQMFQYAAGRRLALHHGTDLYLDLTSYSSYPLRTYQLDVLRINAGVVPPELLKRVPFSWWDAARLGIRHHIFGESMMRYEQGLIPDYNEQVLSLPDNVYLDGFWQSEKYFADIPDIIRNEFTFVPPPSDENREILEELSHCNAVSVHIRRGDYVTNPETRRIHYVCDESYYQRAMGKMKDMVDDPVFVIFSDDPGWAKAHIDPGAPVRFISHNPPDRGYEDLRLMVHCRHHIIANSSFSWWGAWLSGSPEKIVLTPEKWFASVFDSDMENRIPPGWIILGDESRTGSPVRVPVS